MDYEAVVKRIKEIDEVMGYLSIEPLLPCAPGQGRASMPLEARHLNSLGIAHGGVVFTLADVAMSMAALWHGEVLVTLNLNISYLNPAVRGPLTAEAREAGASGHISHSTVEIRDGDGQLVALGQGMSYRKKTSLASLLVKQA